MIEKSYKYISDETKSEIDSYEVVTPSLYESIFKKIADKSGVDITDEELKSKEILDIKLEEITAVDNMASKKVMELDKSAKKAIQAITDKNEELLHETLSETELLRKEIEKLKRSLYIDSLTKVFNRKWLNTELIDHEEKFINDGIIFLIDMNYFKHVNDTYGHIAGDKVLLYVANHLNKLDVDVVRYGGDEFLVIFKEKDMSKVLHNLHVNRELLLKKKLKFHNYKFHISYSYGGVEFSKGDEFADILENADELMYSDKDKIKERIKPD